MNLAIGAQLLTAAGLDVRQDAVGNLFARWEGAQPELAPVAVGAPAGLVAIHALRAAGYRPRRAVELIQFAAAEPARFGVACLGSRLLSGAMPAWKAARLTGPDGKTFDDWRAEAGFEGPLDPAVLPAGHYAAFVDLSVAEGAPSLGIVTAFTASAGLRVTVEGDGAESALAEIASEVAKLADILPVRACLEIHVEDADQAKRDIAVSQIAAVCRDTAQRRRIAVKAEVLYMDAPVECAAEIVDALARAAAKRSLAFECVAARGAHDARFLSRIAPAGMLLVPGPTEAAAGAHVLAEALAELAG